MDTPKPPLFLGRTNEEKREQEEKKGDKPY